MALEDPTPAVCCAMREKNEVRRRRVPPGTGNAKRPLKSGLGSRAHWDHNIQNDARPPQVFRSDR
jgi:hypothetical protein